MLKKLFKAIKPTAKANDTDIELKDFVKIFKLDEVADLSIKIINKEVRKKKRKAQRKRGIRKK